MNKGQIKRAHVNMKKLFLLFRENSPSTVMEFIYRKLTGSKKEVSVLFFGRALYLRPCTPDLNVAFSCFSGEFDQLRNHIDGTQKGVIIDAGGYIGIAAMVISEMFPNATVVSIEPSHENFLLLTKNVANCPNVKPLRAALMPEAHSGTVRMLDRDAGEWGYVVDNEENEEATYSIAEAISIREIMEKYDCESLLAVKMDIEGSERALLLEHSTWLPQTKVLLIELHPDLCPDIESIYELACQSRARVVTSGEKHMSVMQK